MAQEIIKKNQIWSQGSKTKKYCASSTLYFQTATDFGIYFTVHCSKDRHCRAAAGEVLHVGWVARSVLGLITPSLRHTSPVNGPLCPGLESKSCRMPLCTWPQKHLRAEGFKVLTGFEILWFSNICDWRLEKYVAMQLQSNLHFSLYPTNF